MTIALLTLFLSADHVVNGRTFSLPDGFVIECIAKPPLVKHPVHAAFDDKGRLLVTEVSGSNAPIAEQLKTLPHKVVRLTDDNGDGVFDRSDVWAKDLPMPQGILWYEGSAYVAAPPAIWKLQSKPDDTGSLPKNAWYDPKTATGCNNDLHGPWLGPDGWFYWTKGAFAEQTHELVNGKKLTTKASMLLRRRPEGGPVDVLMTGGMDNPVGLAFLPNGERIVSGTFLHHPGGGLRDGMIHALYGGVYGKDHDAINGLPRTGDLLPVMTECGPAAPSSVIRYEGDLLDPRFQNNLFLCQFNLRKVSRHFVTNEGVSDRGTYRTEDFEFLSSPDVDFHPTDVIQDADGSLLVVDTGGWYKLCCPTSQIEKPEVAGAIYRIRRANAKRVDDPRGERIEWTKTSDDALIEMLKDPRKVVKWKAVDELARRGSMLRSSLHQQTTSGGWETPVWPLARMQGRTGTTWLELIIANSFNDGRVAAANALATHRDPKSLPTLLKMQRTVSSWERRSYLEALGRVGAGSPLAVQKILRDAANQTGRSTLHAIRFALWEIDNPAAIEAEIQGTGTTNEAMAAAIWAVCQHPTYKPRIFTTSALIAFAEHQDKEVRAAARFALLHRTEHGGEVAAWLRTRLTGAPFASGGWESLKPVIVASLGRSEMQKIVAEWVANQDPKVRAFVWSLMGEHRSKTVPAVWIDSAVERTPKADAGELAAAMPLLRRSVQLPRLRKELAARAADRSLPNELRFALMSLAPSDSLDEASFSDLTTSLATDRPVELRTAAADALGAAKLSTAQATALTTALLECGPLEIERLLPAFTATKNIAVGEALVAAIERAKARKALRIDDLKKRLEAFGPSLKPAVERLAAKFAADRAGEAKRLEELATKLPKGDAKRGLLVYNGTKATCRTCHKLGYVGGDLGPELSKIGSIRSRRDLLESVVFPNASFVRSYEPTTISLKDGRSVNGLIRRETAEELVIATALNQEQRIATKDVESRVAGSVSIMPTGMDQQLSPQELADLIAFLESAK